MGLFWASRIDRDFPGGIYLPALGTIPREDHIERVATPAFLWIPLAFPGRPGKPLVRPGDRVRQGQPLVASIEQAPPENSAPGQATPTAPCQGLLLRAPCDGEIISRIRIATEHCPECEALVLKPSSPGTAGEPTPVAPGRQNNEVHDSPPHRDHNNNQNDHHDQGPMPGDKKPLSQATLLELITRQELDTIQRQSILEQLRQAGLWLEEGMTTRPLTEVMAAVSGPIHAVIANATPLEPTLNTAAALVRLWPEQVMAGLAILKTWFRADKAFLAYPHHLPIERASARYWHVDCVEVSEKYPQGLPPAILRTLIQQKRLPGRSAQPPVSAPIHQPDSQAIAFPIPLLRQVERVVLAQELPVRRIVTIQGNGVTRPGHFDVLIGTPLSTLLEMAEAVPSAQVAAGASMTGTLVDAERVAITGCCDCFTVFLPYERKPTAPCIRCGWCLEDCPARIDPAALYQYAEQGAIEQARKAGLSRCLRCGICSYVCPSQLPIMEAIIDMQRHNPAATTETTREIIGHNNRSQRNQSHHE